MFQLRAKLVGKRFPNVARKIQENRLKGSQLFAEEATKILVSGGKKIEKMVATFCPGLHFVCPPCLGSFAGWVWFLQG